MKPTNEFKQIMQDRFGHDTLLSVATVSDGIPKIAKKLKIVYNKLK